MNLSLHILVGLAFLELAYNQSLEKRDAGDYCKQIHKCGSRRNKVHTVCYWMCKVSNICKDSYEDVETNDTVRQYILDMHNVLRNYVALGNATMYSAADMMTMNWNVESEYVTYCYAKRCTGKHDQCRKSKGFGYTGQNIWKTSATRKIDASDIAHIRRAALEWFSEKKHMTKTHARLSSFYGTNANGQIGHFIQLIWAKTYTVGCSRGSYRVGKVNMITIICNYAPGGNIGTHPVYTAGAPQSQCPPGAPPNKEYKGLCGELKLLSSERIHISLPRNSSFPNITVNLLSIAISILLTMTCK